MGRTCLIKAQHFYSGVLQNLSYDFNTGAQQSNTPEKFVRLICKNCDFCDLKLTQAAYLTPPSWSTCDGGSALCERFLDIAEVTLLVGVGYFRVLHPDHPQGTCQMASSCWRQCSTNIAFYLLHKAQLVCLCVCLCVCVSVCSFNRLYLLRIPSESLQNCLGAAITKIVQKLRVYLDMCVCVFVSTSV